MSQPPFHAGLIARYGADGWSGVLIEGASGAGTSDLALRCLALGFRLVADDRTDLWISRGWLYGAAPRPIAGLIEIRGLGVLPEPALRFAEVRLAVRCLAPADGLERLPEPAARRLLGVAVPQVAVRSSEASAPQKVLRALSLLGRAP